MASGRIRGITLVIDADTGPVKKALSTFEKQTKQLKDTLKDINKLLKLDPKNTELLTQKQAALKQRVDETEKWLQTQKKTLAQLAEGDQTPRVIERQERLKRNIIETENELKQAKRELNSFGSVGAQQIQAFGKQVQDVGQKIKDVGDKVVSLGYEVERLTLPLQLFFGSALKFSMDFDKRMSQVQAVSNATSEEMEAMRQAAIDWGEKTVYTAEETGEALYYMGLAGWNAEESIAALPAVLDLAAAGNVDLGRASSIVVDGMSALGYQAKDAVHFVNVMAAGMSNANTTVDLLGDSMKYAAALGGALDYSIEDLTLQLGLMASAGIKGSQAGTGLRQALKQLASPTEAQAAALEKYNISIEDGLGNALPFLDVITLLRDRFGKLDVDVDAVAQTVLNANGEFESTDALLEAVGDAVPLSQMEKFKAVVDIVGIRALPGMLGAINATQEDFEQLKGAVYGSEEAFVRYNGHIYPMSEALETFGDRVYDAAEGFEILGAAAGMREIMLDNLAGDWVRLTSALGTTKVIMGDIAKGALRELVQGLLKLVQWFNNADPKTQKMIMTIGLIVAAIGPALIIVGKVISAVGLVVKAIGTVIAIGGKLIAIIAAIGAGPALLVAGIAAAVVLVVKYWDEIKAAFVETWEAIKSIFSAESMENLKQGLVDSWEDIKGFFVDIWNAIVEAGKAIWESISNFFIDTWNSIKEKAAEIWESVASFFKGVWEGIKLKATEIWNSIATTFKTVWEGIKLYFQTALEFYKTLFTNVWNGIKTVAISIWNGLKTQAGIIFNALKMAVTNPIGALKYFLSSTWENIKNTAARVWEGIKKVITSPIDAAVSTIKGLIEKVKGFFPIRLSNIFSGFKLPHINVTMKTGFMGIKYPKFSVDWYKKAYANAMRFDSPTVLATPNGPKGFGDGNGAEWVIGENSLLSLVQGAVSSGFNSEAIAVAAKTGIENAKIAIYLDGREITNSVTRRITATQASNSRFM